MRARLQQHWNATFQSFHKSPPTSLTSPKRLLWRWWHSLCSKMVFGLWYFFPWGSLPSFCFYLCANGWKHKVSHQTRLIIFLFTRTNQYTRPRKPQFNHHFVALYLASTLYIARIPMFSGCTFPIHQSSSMCWLPTEVIALVTMARHLFEHPENKSYRNINNAAARVYSIIFYLWCCSSYPFFVFSATSCQVRT